MFEFLYALLVIFVTQIPGVVFWLRGRKQNHYTTRFMGLTFMLYAFLFLVLVGCLLTNRNFDVSLPCGVIWIFFYCCIPAFILLTYRTLLFVGMYRVHNKVVISDILDRFLNRAIKKNATINRNNEEISRKNITHVGWKQYTIVLAISLIALILMFLVGLAIVGPGELAKYPTETEICDFRMAIVLVAFVVISLAIQTYCMFLLRDCRDGLGISLELMVMLVITLPCYLVFAIVVLVSTDKIGVQNASYIGLVPTYILISTILYFPQFYIWLSKFNVREQAKSYQYPYFEAAFKDPVARAKMEEIAKKRLCSELMNFMKVFDEMETSYLKHGANRNYQDLGQVIVLKYLLDQSQEQVCLNEDVVVRILEIKEEEQIPFEFWLIAKKDIMYMIYENIYKFYVDQ